MYIIINKLYNDTKAFRTLHKEAVETQRNLAYKFSCMARLHGISASGQSATEGRPQGLIDPKNQLFIPTEKSSTRGILNLFCKSFLFA